MSVKGSSSAFDISKKAMQRDGWWSSDHSEEPELIYDEWINELNFKAIFAELNIPEQSPHHYPSRCDNQAYRAFNLYPSRYNSQAYRASFNIQVGATVKHTEPSIGIQVGTIVEHTEPASISKSVR